MIYGFQADSTGGSFGYIRWRNKLIPDKQSNYVLRVTGGGFGWVELINPPSQEQIEAMEGYRKLSLLLFSDEYSITQTITKSIQDDT